MSTATHRPGARRGPPVPPGPEERLQERVKAWAKDRAIGPVWCPVHKDWHEPEKLRACFPRASAETKR